MNTSNLLERMAAMPPLGGVTSVCGVGRKRTDERLAFIAEESGDQLSVIDNELHKRGVLPTPDACAQKSSTR
jgi:hypothetical protein